MFASHSYVSLPGSVHGRVLYIREETKDVSTTKVYQLTTSQICYMVYTKENKESFSQIETGIIRTLTSLSMTVVHL